MAESDYERLLKPKRRKKISRQEKLNNARDRAFSKLGRAKSEEVRFVIVGLLYL